MERVQVSVGSDQPKKVVNEAKAQAAPAGEQPKKVRRKKGLGTGSPMDIPQHMIPHGVDLQWVIDTCNGQAFSTITNDMMNGGCWEPVTVDMWEGRFANIWTRAGYTGPIMYGGQYLCWRPMELTLEARAEEREQAMAPVNMTRRAFRDKQVPGMTPEGRTAQANANTGLTETFAPIPD